MAGKDGAGDDGGTGMEPQALKAVLRSARKNAVSVALGQGDAKSGGLCLVLMHRAKAPKQLVKELKKQFPKATGFCFGTALVDVAEGPPLLKLQMNRRVAGLDRRLRKSLRGTGVGKVAIEAG